jgi:glycosyltransferase involved in cell wall biosynthesis
MSEKPRRHLIRKMERKKVLIITWYFPPRPNVSSIRLRGLAKYLKDYDWTPIILTGELPNGPRVNCRTVQTPYRDIMGSWKRKFGFDPDREIRTQIKLISNKESFKNSVVEFALQQLVDIMASIISYPDPQKGWYPYAIEYARRILEGEGVDAIISSYMPATCHLIAKELKEEYKIPWIADLRDLWSQDEGYGRRPLRRMIERRLEKRTLSKADALVTVSWPLAEKLKELHKDRPVYVITNGFDPEEENPLVNNLTAKFTVTWTGNVYHKWQDPLKILEATRSLISEGTIDPDDIEIRFYGSVYGSRDWWLEDRIKQVGLQNVAKFYGQIPREEVIEKQRTSQVLLLLKWEGSTQGSIPGKLFEYLAARRPILATGGETKDVVTELLQETQAGIHAANVEDVKSALKKFYYEYKLDGQVKYKGKKSKINKYSHKEMARKFSEILDTLTRTSTSNEGI